MFLEHRRVWSNFRDKGRARLLCEFLVIPFLVALMLMFAYVWRDNANDQRTSFVYFCTLYAFWCGLFGSCQAFNGEAASGEWSYWVLGQRRPLLPHLLAHFVVGLLSAMLQLVVCAVLMEIISLFKADASLVRSITDMLTDGGEYGLKGYWQLLNWGSTVSYYWAVLKYLLVALFAATLSGTCLGLLVSSLFRNPQVSLSVSVCLIVACSVLSQTSIRGEIGSNARDFAPTSLVLRQRLQCARHDVKFCRYRSENLTAWRDGGLVELSSWLLPQRFFFNIARLPFLKLEAGKLDSSNWDTGETLYRHQQVWNDLSMQQTNVENEVCGCLCPACIDLISIRKETVTNDFRDLDFKYYVGDSQNEGWIPYDKHWLHSARDTAGHWKELAPGLEEPGNDGNPAVRMKNQTVIVKMFRENSGGIRSYVGFFREMLWGEMMVIIGQSAILLVVSLMLLKKKEVFNELR